MEIIVVFIARYLYIVSLAVAAIYFFWQPRHVQKSMAMCGVSVATLAFVLSRIAAHIWYDPRPFVAGHFMPLVAHVADNGFPSDHALLAGTVAAALWFQNKKISGLLWAATLLIGWARVYVGVHHVADIAGSIAIILVSMVAYYAFNARRTAGRLPENV